jgi:uncharacterized protein
MLAGRHGSLGNPTQYSSLGRNGILIGFGFGLPLSLLGAWWAVGSAEPIGSFRQTVGEAVVFAAAPLVTWAYLGLLAAFRSKWANVLAIFRPAGRMSLTIYIGESAMMSLLFCAYGVGLFGRLGIAAVGFCSVVVWALLATFAYYYQQRWRTGPLESLLRYWST